MLTDDQAARAMGILKRMAAQSHCCYEDREDVVQSALLRLVEHGPVLDAGLEFMCSWAVNAPAQRSYQMMESAAAVSRKELDRMRGLGRLVTSDDDDVRKIDAAEAVDTAANTASLNDLERHILNRLVTGHKQSDIAESLGIACETVWYHVTRIKSKFSEFVRLGLL